MIDVLDADAASAIRWRGLQHVGVQVVYFARLLILATLLTPEDFGLLAIAMIAVGLLMTLSELGMIPALVQKQDATRAQYDGAWTVGLVRAGSIAAILFLAAPLFARLFDEPIAAPIIQALALRPLIDAAASIGIARLTREMRFRPLAIMYFCGAVVDLVVAVAAAPAFGVWALVAGALAGSVVTALLSYVLAPHRPRLSFQWDEIAPLVNFGRWILAAGVTSLAATFLTQLAVSRMLGAAALGLYFIALKVAFLPLNTASAVIGPVAFPMFARSRSDPEASTGAFATLLAALFLLLLPVYGLLFVLAPQFEEALGPQWAGTAPLIRILSLAGVVCIFGELLGPLFLGRGEAQRAFRLEVLQTAGLLASLLPALWLLGVTGTGVSWLVGAGCAGFWGLWWATRIAPGAMRRALPRMQAAAGAGLAAAAASWWIADGLHGMTGLAVAGAAGIAIAAGTLWLLDRLFGLDLGGLLTILMQKDGA